MPRITKTIVIGDAVIDDDELDQIARIVAARWGIESDEHWTVLSSVVTVTVAIDVPPGYVEG